jgi:ABC-type multidrug transport system ATPase subunit
LPAVLEIENLGKTYRRLRCSVEALKDFSWACGSGIHGLIGQNGAGKTTLLRICAALLRPSIGAVSLDGRDIQKQPQHLKGRLGYVPQDFGVIPHWTVNEFLHFLLLSRDDKMTARERSREVDRVLDQVQMTEWRNQFMGALSGGMKRRIGIAQALFGNPTLLLLDEPTAGLDPDARMMFRTLLQELSLRSTIILSTHLIEDVIRMCKDAAF